MICVEFACNCSIDNHRCAFFEGLPQKRFAVDTWCLRLSKLAVDSSGWIDWQR